MGILESGTSDVVKARPTSAWDIKFHEQLKNKMNNFTKLPCVADFSGISFCSSSTFPPQFSPPDERSETRRLRSNLASSFLTETQNAGVSVRISAISREDQNSPKQLSQWLEIGK